MGLIISTGFFKYIPPNPKITSTSSPTGALGQVISINGEDLDYVDTLSFAGENLNFTLTNGNQKMDFLVPSNPDTGKLLIASDTFTITGQNNLPFLPIFELENFDPVNGSEGDIINISGKVLTSIQTGYIYASPILNDINYYFSGRKNYFDIPMSTKSGVYSLNFAENISPTGEINNFEISAINPFNFSSGASLNVGYNIPGNLSKKYYENHLLSLSEMITTGFQSYQIRLPTGFSGIEVPIASGLNHTNYAVFLNMHKHYPEDLSTYNFNHIYISEKTTGSFQLNISTVLDNEMDVDILLFTSSGFMLDSGVFERNFVNIPANLSSEIIYFDRLSGVDRQNNLYPPFLFTSIEKIDGINIGNSYISANVSNLEKNNFTINVPNKAINNTFRLNYFTIKNDYTNLATFVYEGDKSYYKKVYLFTGSQETFQERLPMKNIAINNKNNLSFEVPSTDYYINCEIELINNANILKKFITNFIETPTPTSVNPSGGFNGTNISIQGKSFKKPILIDNAAAYDSCFVRFRYADNIYPENKSTFQTSFRIINKELLSGSIPLSSIPTGRYAIQMMSENGGLFE